MKNLIFGILFGLILSLSITGSNIWASDKDGNVTNVFTIGEKIYATSDTCDNVTTGLIVRLYVVEDANWGNGETLDDVSVDGYENYTILASPFQVAQAVVWANDFKVGKYDLIENVGELNDTFGVLDLGYDCIDNNTNDTPGFIIKGTGSIVAGSGTSGSEGVLIEDHNWFYNASSSDLDNEMLQFKVSASGEDLVLKTITLNASGTGDDSIDVAKINVYKDANNNGVYDEDDVLIGSANGYSMDDGNVTIALNLTVSKTIAARILITYVMDANATLNKTYSFNVISINATGKISEQLIDLSVNLPLISAVKMIIAAPEEQPEQNQTVSKIYYCYGVGALMMPIPNATCELYNSTDGNPLLGASCANTLAECQSQLYNATHANETVNQTTPAINQTPAGNQTTGPSINLTERFSDPYVLLVLGVIIVVSVVAIYVYKRNKAEDAANFEFPPRL